MSLLKNILFCTIFSAFVPALAQTSSPFSGMTGKEILGYIRNNCRPTKTVGTQEEIKKAITSYAYSPGSGYREYFSTTSLGQLNTIAVVPLVWWGQNSDDYAAVSADLHNIVPANVNVASNRDDYPPGVVDEIVYTNDYWRAGIGSIAGMETNFYEPADELKGDFARIYMYMASAYPQPLWNGRGAMLYLDGYFPVLTSYGKQLLLDWHRADPVDDAELRRDAAIAASQGNSNPFVSEPSLAEYIWGIYADRQYNSGDNPDNPDEPQKPDEPTTPEQPAVEPIMLKAVYSVSEDQRIDFRSPYVAAGSVWTIDGKTVTGESMNLKDIGLGRHELSYSNARSRGKIIITVEP